MICKSCKCKVDDIDIYCKACGKPTENGKKQFKVGHILKDATKDTRPIMNGNIFAFIVIVILVLFGSVYLLNFHIQIQSEWIKYLVLNALLVVVLPLLILPLANVATADDSEKIHYRYYTRLLVLIGCMAIYFGILKIVCQGDPILNLVRLVLVLWGLAIVFPVPFLIFTSEEPVFKLIRKAYIAGKYLRWHQFYLCMICGVRYLISYRYVGKVMFCWYQKQEKFRLYDRMSDY
jgi:hypothetical protein